METNKQINFILSTGRTGTMFFEDYINETSTKALCRHEPKPSRRFIPLSNMHFEGKISSARFNKFYFSARKSLFTNCPETYIESSNFMWSGVFALNESVKNLRILHLIRHPQDYIKSHYDYGFWNGYKRLIRRNIPYFVADLPISAKQKKDPIMVLAARWKLINETLMKYKETNPYLQVKFENIFKSGVKEGAKELNQIRDFFGLEEYSLAQTEALLSKPKNTSRKKDTKHKIDSYKSYIADELGELMDLYNYKLK